MTIPENTPQLPLALYRLTFELQQSTTVPLYLGSAWRGVLGHALKESVCVTRQAHCDNCIVRQRCAYSYLFETPPPPDSEKMRRYTAVPHPFVINPLPHTDRRLEKGSTLSLHLTLIGQGNDYLPYFIHAFQQAGIRGLGQRHTPFTLIHVEQRQTPNIGQWSHILGQDKLTPLPTRIVETPTPTGDIRIQFHQPMRLRRNGKNITPNTFQFSDFFSSLLRRVSHLQYFHTPHALETDFAALTEQAYRVKIIAPQLRWQEQQRRSNRQQSQINTGGLMGEFTLSAQQLPPFWPYLWLGQWINTGKGAVMGMGQYSLVPAIY